jgi:hypothetical protein
MYRMIVLINNVMGLKNIITIAFLGIGDTLLIFFCHFIAKVEETGNNYVKWCKYLVAHYDFHPILSKFAFFY